MQKKTYYMIDIFTFIINNWTKISNIDNNADFNYCLNENEYRFNVKVYSSLKQMHFICTEKSTDINIRLVISYASCIESVNSLGIESFINNIKINLITQLKYKNYD